MTVVSNTSPILNLALIKQLHPVEAQFGEVLVSTAVWNELTAGFDGRDRIGAFRHRGGMRVVSPESTNLRTEFERELNRGEAAAIAYAVNIDADRVRIDEREGRAAATHYNIPVTGVVGIPLRASARKEIDLDAEMKHYENPRNEDEEHKIEMDNGRFLKLVGGQRRELELGIRDIPGTLVEEHDRIAAHEDRFLPGVLTDE